MNKKILLLFILAAMFSILAFSVYAGDTACGLGGCAAASVSSTSVSTGSFGLSSQSFSPSNTSWGLYCSNFTGTPCLNSTTPLLSVCNAPNDVACGVNTIEILNQRLNATNVTNITYVATLNKSSNFAFIGYDNTAAMWKLFIGFKLDSAPVLKTYFPNTPFGMTFSLQHPQTVTMDKIELSGGAGILVSLVAEVTAGGPVGDNVIMLLTFDSNGNLQEQLGFSSGVTIDPVPRDTRIPLGVTVDEQNPSQFAYGWINLGGATPYGYDFGINLTSPLFLSGAKSNIWGGDNGGRVIDVFPTSEVITRNSKQVTKMALIAYADESGPATKLILASNVWPDNMQNNTIKIYKTAASKDVVPLSAAQVRDKDHVLSSAIYDAAGGVSQLFTTITDHSGSTPVASPSGINYTILLDMSFPSTGQRGAPMCSGLSKANVKATFVDALSQVPYFLVFNSLGGLLASFSSSDTASFAADTVCVNPAVHVVQLPQAIYGGTNQTASLVAVTQGSSLIDSFYVYNMTVDSGAVLQANASGGHSGNYMYYVLGGRSTNNSAAFLDYFNTSLALSAINPNGTTRFSTDKIVQIATYNPDINILNFKLDWQTFNGTFDTTNGTCLNCSFDGANDPLAAGNGWCQAEVEKIWGMFQNYNLTISLVADKAITMDRLLLVCRSYWDTTQINSNCTRLSIYQDTNGNCFTANVPAAYAAYASVAGNAVYINLTALAGPGFNLTNMPFGSIAPDVTCEQIACEVVGNWVPGDTQEFTVNKTITVTAI